MASLAIAQRALEALDRAGCVKPLVRAADSLRAPASYVWVYEARDSDPYWVAAMAAWRRIAAHPYLPGAVRWVEKHQPALYRELMEELPGEIDRLWDSGVPIPRFQAVLNCWVEAHQKAVDLYSVRRRGKLGKNGEPCKGRGEL